MLPLDARRRSRRIGRRWSGCGPPASSTSRPDGRWRCGSSCWERLGADTILQAGSADGVRMTARTAANFAPPLGDIARFRDPPRNIHLFDPETGRRL